MALLKRPDGAYYINDSTSVDFAAKFEDAFRVAATASKGERFTIIHAPTFNQSGNLIELDWNRPVAPVRPTATSGLVSFDFIGNGSWHGVHYRGPSGNNGAFLRLFDLVGVKQYSVRNFRVVSHASYVMGMGLSTDATFGSTGSGRFQDCRWQPSAGTTNNIGFYTHNGGGGADVSYNTFDKCEAYADGFSGTPVQQITQVTSAGHIGFAWFGGNTLANVMRDCSGVGMFNGVRHQSLAGADPQSGGSGQACYNFGSSWCAVVFQVDGGFDFFAHGGRHELMGHLLVHGWPNSAGQQLATVALRDIQAQSFFQGTTAPLLGIPRNAVIACHSASNYRFETCHFSSWFDTAGNNVGTSHLNEKSWLSLANVATDTVGSVNIVDCRLFNGDQPRKMLDPSHVLAVQGKWSVNGIVQDGGPWDVNYQDGPSATV